MKIVSFNVNGIRARIHQLQALVEKHQPDIIGVQEIKVQDSEFPHEQLTALDYRIIHHGQKGHFGVATFSRLPVTEVVRRYPDEDADHQRRLLITRHELGDGRSLQLINGYFPQGENRSHPEKFPNKEIFYRRLHNWLQEQLDPQDWLVVLGDMNVAPQDSDVGIGEENRQRWLRTGKCCFLPEERDWLAEVMDWGLVDTFRAANPDNADCFSWFDYRSRGFEREPKRGLRIDLILATEALNQHCRETGIDYQLRGMPKPSDHCPVWADFDL